MPPKKTKPNEKCPCKSGKNSAMPSSSFGFKKGFLNTKKPSSAMASKSRVVPQPGRSRAPQPGRDACLLCYHILPLQRKKSIYKSCCGKTICYGCIVGLERAHLLKEAEHIIEGITTEEDEFQMLSEQGGPCRLCPFCRTEMPSSDEDYMRRINKRVDICNDDDYTIALIELGTCYELGKCGVPRNYEKAEGLYKQAYDLDDPQAAWKLFCLRRDRYPSGKDIKKMEYLQRGVMLGNISCIDQLVNYFAMKQNSFEDLYRAGGTESINELVGVSMKGARLGGDTKCLMMCYKKYKLPFKDDLATTLRAHQTAKNEMKTVQREYAQRLEKFHADNLNLNNEQ